MRLSPIFVCAASMLFAAPTVAEDAPRALSLSQSDMAGGMFEASEAAFVEALQSNLKGAGTFDSPDGRFSIGGTEFHLTDESAREMDYVDFPRNEFMYFSQGGMRLVEPDGTVVEAGPGEVLFIPQGWTGKRILVGDDIIQKVSVVYTAE